MSGVVVKLGMMAVPNHAQKWVRVRSTITPNPPLSPPLSLSPSLNTKKRREKVKDSLIVPTTATSTSTTTTAIYRTTRDGYLGWRRSISPPAHVNHPLGLLSPPPSASSSSSSSAKRHYSSSSEDRGALSADMGSENKGHQDLNGKEANHDLKPPVSSKFLTLPTVLTLGRIAAVPLLIATFYVDSWWGTTATTSIFIAAAITDWLDGYIARKMRLGSAFGAFLDPVADKLMVAATLVLLCTRPFEVPGFGQVPWLLTVPAIAIIGRESHMFTKLLMTDDSAAILWVCLLNLFTGLASLITMSAVREWAASQNTKLLEAVAVNNLGKWKTATQMIALTILLATRDTSLGAPAFLVASGVVLLYISAGLAVWSLAVYMSKIWRVLLR
ncbi:hypothetical protein TIFTF001_020352 [Ficus carica]|uniref:CDP-diacylglycerol--glycerol-3-phosphate 3-phosphatidyltransferase n=1 Tax=Ficus carica TaxID=3494 RepID=A0AA88DJK9_FICCA|nr:hypothetical protein TIFTF001_020352 [Ficus carica]